MVKALRIARIGLNVSDLDASCALYETALGFTRDAEETRGGEAFEALTGLPGARARIAILSLGAQQIELAAFEPAGAPYARAPAANDRGFQHFAIAVSDMDAACARLAEAPCTPISEGGPQLLPPSTGSVTAYKFRDPDGHPLELSFSPDSHWPRGPEASPFRGVDHTALAVADLATAAAFYHGLIGMRLGGRGLNQGPEQDRLDGLGGVVLDIGVLNTADPGPHIELLRYRSPEPRQPTRAWALNDIAATRTVIEVTDFDQTFAELLQTHATLVSSRATSIAGRPRCMLRDPDGHVLELVG